MLTSAVLCIRRFGTPPPRILPPPAALIVIPSANPDCCPMKPRPVDECLVASTELIVTTRSKLAQLQFSVDTCVTR